MIDNINLVQVGGPYGDECSSYTFTTTKEHYTIQELIGAARRNTPEWGYIRVVYGEVEYKLEYRHGQIISNDIPEFLYDKEFTEGSAHGGWSNMDYLVTITPDNHGGKRQGAGRPRKGESLRESMTISVDPAVKETLRRLREDKGLADFNEIIGGLILKCEKEGLIPIPGAEPQFEQTETGFVVKLPCIKVK